MKKHITLLVLVLCSFYNINAQNISKEVVFSKMKQIADWQMKQKDVMKYGALCWTNATLYLGMSRWAEIYDKSYENKYYSWLDSIGESHKWGFYGKNIYIADHLAIAQTYFELYRKSGNHSIIEPTISRIDYIIKNPSDGSFLLSYAPDKGSTLERWTWCDALFMAPAVYAKMFRLTSDLKYFDFMNSEFKTTYDFLFDREENLFYRDFTYFLKREKNGEKVFWGRGNGWVLGGLCEILKELPLYMNERNFYVNLFCKMMKRIVGLQQEDGFWRASLLDPQSYPSPETSGSAFYVYALAYGINSGLLKGDVYNKALVKGWNALVSAINKDGKLGYVQAVGADPQSVTKDMTEVYGTGAFLLAASEIYKMQ